MHHFITPVKKPYYRTGLIILIGVLSAINAFTQSASEQHVIQKFDAYRSEHLQEKMYVHTDRTMYLTGETLWFKVYLVDGSFHQPLDLSKVGYLEIIKDQTAVLQTKIELKKGFGNGSLFLPATLGSGNYYIRAYTSWMRNSGPELYFYQPITILNTFKTPDIAIEPAPSLSVSFFPEGGNLVDGLASKIAFKIQDQDGNGVYARGVIVNEKNDTVTSFTPLKFGLGNFIMTPSRQHQYRALLIDKKGKVNSFTLPEIYPEGYVMNVKEQLDELIVTVESKNSNTENIVLFAHSRQVITTTLHQSIAQGVARFSLPKSLLRDGINHLTIFNNELKPVCERLYFKRPVNTMNIALSSNLQQYNTRDKVVMNIAATNENNQPLNGNLSLSVFKVDSLPSFSHMDIRSYLYLTADLTGIIESPDYYLTGTDERVKEATDNLMLTHGWRRFNWKNLLTYKSEKPEFIPEFRSHLVKGTVRTLSGEPAGGVTTYLSAPGKSIRLYLSNSNQQGRVQYEMKNFYGPQKLIVQTNPKYDSTYKLEIHSPFSDKFSVLPSHSLRINSSHEKSLLNRAISMQVQDIFFEDHLNRFKILKQDSSAFYGDADESYRLDDYTRFPVMEEVMREYVKGVWVRKRKDGFHFLVLDNVNHSVFDDDPLILLDGVPVFDVNAIMELNPINIQQLDVFTRVYYMGNQTFPGIVSYTSFARDMAGYQLGSKTLTLDYEGLQLQREFYAPRYDKVSQRNNRLPDQRTLLSWTPEIVTDQEGKAKVEFYTSDVEGDFIAVVEGITAKGEAGSITQRFKVVSGK